MKLDGKMLAQAMLRRKQNKDDLANSGEDAEAAQLEQGSHIQEMQYFAECLNSGKHADAHNHLKNIIKAIHKGDEDKKEADREEKSAY
jgi:hypothetical protein